MVGGLTLINFSARNWAEGFSAFDGNLVKVILDMKNPGTYTQKEQTRRDKSFADIIKEDKETENITENTTLTEV